MRLAFQLKGYGNGEVPRLGGGLGHRAIGEETSPGQSNLALSRAHTSHDRDNDEGYAEDGVGSVGEVSLSSRLR